MSQAHISTARLQALHDGEPDHRRELEHLASCPVCQEAFDDTRWTMLLMSLRSATESVDAHPDRDELLAFQTGSLATRRHASIREHLTHCRRCVTEYARTRAGRQRARYSSPPRKIMQATMAQFRPRKIRRLGRLLVQRLGDNLTLSFLKSPRSDRSLYTDEPIARMGLIGGAETDRHPASASRRAMRMRRTAEQESLQDPAFDACEASDSVPPFLAATIEGSRWDLHVESAPGVSDDSLQVTLTSTDKNRPTAEVKIRIMSERGDESSAVTDARGIAVLPCPSGSSRMIVEVDPPLSVEVQFDD